MMPSKLGWMERAWPLFKEMGLFFLGAGILVYETFVSMSMDLSLRGVAMALLGVPFLQSAMRRRTK